MRDSLVETSLNRKFSLIAATRPQWSTLIPHPCPDRAVGSANAVRLQQHVAFEYVAPTFIYQDINTFPIETSLLVLILESPHRDEFDDGLRAVGPAAGSTGRNLRAYLRAATARARIVPRLQQSRTVYLMNAVQYQCSMVGRNRRVPAKLWKPHRDHTFRRLWVEGGKADFEVRLTRIRDQFPDTLVFNCCTAGVTGDPELRALVADAVHDVGVQAEPLGHPYSWVRYARRDG